MKKTSLALLIAVLIAGLFLGCSQDLTVDADVYCKTDTFCVNGKYFSTLQGAVDYIKSINRMKAAGDNDNVIYLTKDAVGPGAVIADIQGLTIDFAGYTYSFSNVTAVQGNKDGDFGLSITDGSTVTLKGLRQIDLHDSAPRLTMVYISGDSTSLTIEEAPRMVVEPGQFVFWAADGASLTIGGETQIGGGVAATGTEENTPVVTFNDAAEITVSELTADQAVVIINTSADSAISSFAASNGTVLIVSGEGSVTVDSNDSGDEASYEIHNTSAEATITVKTEGGSDQVIEAGQGVVVEEGTPTVGVATYAAAIGARFFETLEEAVDNAESGDTILLLKDIDLTETIIISESLTINLNEKVISASTRAFLVKDGTFTLDGKGTVSCEAYTDDEHSGSVIRLGDNTDTGTPKLIVNKDAAVFTDSEYGITYFGNKTTETVEVFGKVTGYSAALSGNGSSGYENTLVIIREGAVVTSTEGAAVYQPQDGELVIEGGSFSGKAAVYAKAGSVTITGGTFEVTGMDSYREYRYNGNGCEPTGDAIILDSCNYPGGEPSLTIAGNPAIHPADGAHCFAVYHAALTTTDTPEEGIVVPGASVDMTEYEGSGDLYREYGYWNKSNGTWHKLEAVTAGEQAELKGYSTLQGAISAAADGDTVMLLQDVTSSSLFLSKDVVFNGNGHAIYFNGDRGIRINQSDVDVVIKNVALINASTNTDFQRAIQVDSNMKNITLTIDNVTATSTYYTVNLCGDTTVSVIIKDSDITGWGALNVWSLGVSIDAENSSFTGINDKSYNAAGWNDFGTIVLEGDTTEQTGQAAANMTISFKDCTISALIGENVEPGKENKQYPILYNSSSSTGANANTVVLNDCVVNCNGNTNVVVLNNGTDNSFIYNATTFSYNGQDYFELSHEEGSNTYVIPITD